MEGYKSRIHEAANGTMSVLSSSEDEEGEKASKQTPGREKLKLPEIEIEDPVKGLKNFVNAVNKKWKEVETSLATLEGIEDKGDMHNRCLGLCNPLHKQMIILVALGVQRHAWNQVQPWR